MSEMKSLTLNDKTYDSFVDQTAREMAAASFVVKSASGESITVSDTGDRKLFGLSIYGKTTQDGTPTPDAPVELVSAGNGGSIDVGVCEKNMLNVTATTSTVSGVTFTVIGDGSVIANGTATETIFFYLGMVSCAANTAYRLTGCPSGGHDATYRLYIKIGDEAYANDISGGVTFTPTESFERNVVLCIRSGTKVTNLAFCPMVRVASDLDDTYKPYKGQRIAISTPNGLPGIPVTSGGNYTDANGQQWICDEIDFARGVYVQRVERYSFAVADMNNSESYPGWKNAGIAKYYPNANSYLANYGAMSMCNIDSNSRGSVHINTVSGSDVLMIPNPNGMTQSEWKAQYPNLVFELIVSIPTPNETPLSAEEIAAYSALHTYKDNTTVSNDASAYMELEYVMDAKKYIDGLMTGTIIPATVE